MCPKRYILLYIKQKAQCVRLGILKNKEKMRTNSTIFAHARKAWMASMTLVACFLSLNATAQEELLTLTNGKLLYVNNDDAHSPAEDDARSYPGCFVWNDEQQSWVVMHKTFAENRDITHTTERGDYYMRLDLSDPANPKLGAKATADGPDLYCFWRRTASFAGLYYQEWEGVKYYVVGGKGELRVSTVPEGAAVEDATTWYAWDFGMAMIDVVYNSGSRNENYYWVSLDTTGANDNPADFSWVNSCNTYQRPDQVRFADSTLSWETNWAAREYCCNRTTGDPEEPNIPAVHGALFMPVQYIKHERHRVPQPGEGLTAVTLTATGDASDVRTTMKYGDELAIRTTINAGMPVQVVPYYAEFREEVKRRGINLRYSQRIEEDVFGSKGILEEEHVYYWWEDGGDWSRHDAIPASEASTLVVDSTEYLISRSAQRVLDINSSATPATIRCIDVPKNGRRVEVTVVVHYTNGLTDTGSVELTLSSEVQRRSIEDVSQGTRRGPIVRGYVVGGGRMAMVGTVRDGKAVEGTGNTSVTVSSCDTILAVYGGNDIAGWVQGTATLQLGTRETSAEHPVHIGYVYGGGCGYYTYRGLTYGTTGYPYLPDNYTPGLRYQNYYFGSEVEGQECVGEVYPWNYRPTYRDGHTTTGDIATDTAYLVWDRSQRVVDVDFTYKPTFLNPDMVDESETGTGGNGTVPYIKTAHIYVGIDAESSGLTFEQAKAKNDNILIDSLFGGAENSFIGIDADGERLATAVTIDINGGTLFTVFGGNNYGGSVAKKAEVHVNVHDTKLFPYEETETVNGEVLPRTPGIDTYFDGYGREYGIRYLFGGGNLVDGAHTEVTVTGGMIDTCYLGGNRATVVSPVGTVNCVGTGRFICTNPSYAGIMAIAPDDRTTQVAANPAWGPYSWHGGVGSYNIRTIFGGNNKADMALPAVIYLESGGVSSVYGGGNMGNMTNEGGLTRPEFRAMMARAMVKDDLTPIHLPMPNGVGSIIFANNQSNIIVDYAYGGSRMGNIKRSCGAYLAGGVFGYVNGGNDVSGDVGSETDGGSYIILDSNVVVLADAVAGSDGYYHCETAQGTYNQNPLYDTYTGETFDTYDEFIGMLMPTHNSTNIAMKGGLVKGMLYGGGTHANVGFADGSRPQIQRGLDKFAPTEELNTTAIGGTMRGRIHFDLTGGRIMGNVFGGGFMSSTYGLTYLHVGGDIQIDKSLFAGNDMLGRTMSFGAYRNYAYDFVEADLENYAAVESSNGDKLNRLEDGKYQSNFSSYLRVDGTPRIGCVYGSGNGAYDYDGERPEYEPATICSIGGQINRPRQQTTYLDINVEGGRIDTVFGGGNGVGVEENVVVLLNAQNHDAQYVGTIFGGNNRDNMDNCVPDIILHHGVVQNVYGGGNAGNMNGAKEYTDACGNMVSGVSTYIKVDNPNVTVQGDIYGGCRMADVKGMAYIDIRSTTEEGILAVYGGNDVGGSVNGNTRIDVSGGKVHHIYGGSNGGYDYDRITNTDYMVYEFGSDHTDEANLVAAHASGRPFVDSTTIHLWGGTFYENVYGGGRMGDCRATNVIVNDAPTAEQCPNVGSLNLELTLMGSACVYGGGEGFYKDLNKERVGNVLARAGDDNTDASTNVHLHHATNVGTAIAYGGGRGGDVFNTNITAYDTWNHPFTAIYGGCWGSDVLGVTNVTMNGAPDGKTASNVYGGNDFTGNVYKTNININGGTYDNIFGGGNGDYAEGRYTGASGGEWAVYSGTYSAADAAHGYTQGVSKRIYVPNNEYAEINFNDGNVNNNIYGGGNMGTTMRIGRNDNDTYRSQGGGASLVADTNRSLNDLHNLPETDATKYSYIMVNLHGGTIENNVYSGAKGAAQGSQLVYGLKQLNMEGGLVKDGVYGGSENVNDGYPNECISKNTPGNNTLTTERPSSILNVTGGTVKGHIYGGGYLGDVHGSVYVNVGVEAVNKSVVWGKTVNGEAGAYARFKPGDASGIAPSLTASEIQLQNSIYGGANWGNNVGNADFSKQGFYGGESCILVDGKDYNTYLDVAHSGMPLMNIVSSIIGSGTSASGGDVYNRIDVRNYGALNPSNCKPTTTLRSIQRADAVWLYNTVIDYTGATDAISAFTSTQYTLNRIDTLNCVGYNVIDVDATVTNIGEVDFYKEPTAWNHGRYEGLTLVDQTNPTLCFTNDAGGCASCDDDPTVCEQVAYLHRPDEGGDVSNYAFTAFVMNNGINVDFINEQGEYAPIYGFAFIIAQNGTNAVITARSKYISGDYEYGYGDHNANNMSELAQDVIDMATAGERDNYVHYVDFDRAVEYGGFLSTCSDSLKAILPSSSHNTVIEWCDCLLESSTTTTDPTYQSYCFTTDGTYGSVGEFPYHNYASEYRTWSIGQGLRRRFTVVQAHSVPDSLYKVDSEGDTMWLNKQITLHYDNGDDVDSLYNLAIATAKITLPPTVPGHYYKIDPNGVVISDENAEMRLTDMAYKPTTWNGLTDEWKLTDMTAKPYDAGTDAAKMEPAGNGTMEALNLTGSGTLTGINKIYKSRSDQQYFGLLMTSGANFATDGGNLVAPKTAPAGWTGSTTLSGNAYTNMITNFSTAQVGSSVNASPELDLYMLYNNNFSHTMLGTVTFTLDEYVAVPKRAGYDGSHMNTNTGDIVLEGGDTVWLDSNLHTPIEIEITISTILQNFANMEYEVLAMYNEGLADIFSRKVVLPATLQRREVFLQHVAWYPTNKETGTGDTLHTASNPTYFYLTDDKDKIKNQTPSTAHSYFGMSVKPMDNISNTIVTAIGWHSITAVDSINLYSAVDKARVEAGESSWNHGVQRVAKGDYYQESGATPAHKLDSVWVGDYVWDAVENAYVPTGSGLPIGVLDGRGEAAIDVSLNYDGERIYDDVDGNGYIGKVVLGLASYTGGDYSHPNKFNITINVKTRAKGDTIYLASDPDGFNITGTDGTTVFSATPVTDFNELNAGKEPHQYVTSFYDAFTKVYQEGDVIAIIDTVKVTAQELIKGNEYMPARIIRYDGHHNQLPGEKCVYRGPMIVVEGANATFTARCIDFVGSSTAKITPMNPLLDPHGASEITADRKLYNLLDPTDVDKYVDTNRAYAPIIVIKDNATVTLQNSVAVKQNWNAYHYDGIGTEDLTRYGAINITDGGLLRMINNVTVTDNLSDSIADPNDVEWRLHPYNGAVYLDGGTIELMESSSKTAITIQNNYLYNDATCDDYWKPNTIDVNGDDKLVGWGFNNSEYSTSSAEHTKANVFLAREEATVIPAEITAMGAAAIQNYKDTVDSKSAYIYFNNTIPENTSIGVTKWFPDEAESLRDTIMIAYQPDATHLAEALYNNNFTSDNGFNVFYSYNVENQHMFLQRCATFKYQVASLTPFYPATADDPATTEIDESSAASILPGDVLTYSPLLGITCPVGGDSITYRVQGGFFPYTYTWTHIDGSDRTVERTRTTQSTNIQINSQIAQHNYTDFNAAVADTFYTSHIELTHKKNEQLILYTVTANDATGNCPLTKNIWINMKKVDVDMPDYLKNPIDDADLDPLYHADHNYDAWVDADNNPGDTARVDRYFRAVKVTPKVWADRNMGTIDAIIPQDSIYEDVEGRPVLNNMLFCEGDIIRFVTVPRTKVVATEKVPVADFIMWDFDPYYNNPATYVVPAGNSQVVAYYGPAAGENQYWKDTVKTTELANSKYDGDYYYHDRDGKSYVTTYHGDVHIYDEDGLAWFISVVNGLNGTQAREFYFNKVYLHKKSAANKYGDASAYHMERHLWTPVGTQQHPFRGWFIGVDNSSDSCTVPLANNDYVVIKNIILNEPDVDYVGFFGFIDTARISGIKIESAMARGAQYVGGIAASSVDSRITNCAVTDSIEDNAATTILTTHHTSGGIVGRSLRDKIDVNISKAKFVGDAVYSGGVVGYGTETDIVNNVSKVFGSNNRKMQGLYLGGLAGHLNGAAPVSKGLFGRKSAGRPAMVTNNYVHLVANRGNNRVGGLVAHASNAVIENNYVYGTIYASAAGSVAAVMDSGSRAEGNYAEKGAANRAAALVRNGSSVGTSAEFAGSGNQVTFIQPSGGSANLTRTLNLWVREHNANGGNYLTWRSDLENTNNGYPVFGTPDMIPLRDTMTVSGCVSVEWDGRNYNDGDSLAIHVVDSTEMIDSTMTIRFVVYQPASAHYTDSATIGQPYEGYGFSLTEAETALLRETMDSLGFATLVLSDTLQTVHGCDSVVTLTLTFQGTLDLPELAPEQEHHVKVYPNPTTSRVTIESDGMQHVELYDNDGRRLGDYDTYSNDIITIDIANYSSGIYYLRIHSASGVTIQKIVKL